MRKNIKTCIYVVTAILPIVLSACSNKNNNMPKSTKESAITTFAEDTSSDIVNTIVETTTEEDTTELISETEQEVINSPENITEQQQTQAEVQQTTIITSFNPTPVPVQTTPRLTETDQTTTPIVPEPDQTTPRPTETTTPIEELYKIKDVIGFEKYSYNGLNFSIRYYFNSDSSITLDIFDFEYGGNFILPETENIPISIVYFKYEVYDSDGNCVKTDFCKVETNSYSCFAIIDIRDLPSTGYTIKLSNYQ